MRYRKIKNLTKRRENCEDLRISYSIPSFDLRNINDKHSYFDFEEIFGNSNPIVLEIGCGKGQFAVSYAQKNPDINIIGIECVPGVLVKACEKALEADIDNIRFLEMRAEYLPIFIKEKSIREIYLNFSTPFPKSKQEKHRLTSPDFLNIYKKILTDDGFIAQKTDSQLFFEYSVESFENNGFVLSNVTNDLHSSDLKENIVTEYEQKFVEQGLPIYRLEARIK